MPMGIETPEDLSRRAGISLGDAAHIMSVTELPPTFDVVARVAAMANVRLTWLSTGKSVMSADRTLHPEDQAALLVLAEMDEEERGRWLRLGQRIVSKKGIT